MIGGFNRGGSNESKSTPILKRKDTRKKPILQRVKDEIKRTRQKIKRFFKENQFLVWKIATAIFSVLIVAFSFGFYVDYINPKPISYEEFQRTAEELEMRTYEAENILPGAVKTYIATDDRYIDIKYVIFENYIQALESHKKIDSHEFFMPDLAKRKYKSFFKTAYWEQSDSIDIDYFKVRGNSAMYVEFSHGPISKIKQFFSMCGYYH